jgi:V-type H+-transporting ATPase proteolipid subunit
MEGWNERNSCWNPTPQLGNEECDPNCYGGRYVGYEHFWFPVLSLPFMVLIYIMIIVIGIYGLIVGVIIGQSVTKPSNDRENSYSTYTGMAHLCAGLCCGVSGLAAGICIGIVGDYGVRAVGYRASSVTLFPSETEREGYSNIPDSDGAAESNADQISGSEDQNKLFVGMLIMLIFSEALAL